MATEMLWVLLEERSRTNSHTLTAPLTAVLQNRQVFLPDPVQHEILQKFSGAVSVTKSWSCIEHFRQQFTVNRYSAVHATSTRSHRKGIFLQRHLLSYTIFFSGIPDLRRQVWSPQPLYVCVCVMNLKFVSLDSWTNVIFTAAQGENPFQRRDRLLRTVTATVPWAMSCFETIDPCYPGTIMNAQQPWVQSDMFKYPLPSV
jgi:hypothetical protein